MAQVFQFCLRRPVDPIDHGCWWSADAMSRGISSHDIELIHPEYSTLFHCFSYVFIHIDFIHDSKLRKDLDKIPTVKIYTL